jgi:lysophospholipase L1-like esterase
MLDKILIMGDSSIPPREELRYENTYSSKLKKKLTNAKVEVSAKTGTSSKKLFAGIEAFLLYGYDPDVVILNYGIVDVYPRPYPNIVYRFLACSGLGTYVDKVLKKSGLYYKIGDLFNFKEVSQKKFQYYSNAIVQKILENKTKKIIFIGIIKPFRGLLKSKNIDKEVIAYNKILKGLSEVYKEVHYIDMYDISDEDFTIWDGYHYSEKASDYLVDKITHLIEND